MRQFTDAEKQQLQVKIKHEQERRDQIAEEIARRKEAEASMSRVSPVVSPLWKYGFLGFVLCLLVFSAVPILFWRDSLAGHYVHSAHYFHTIYTAPMVVLMLLFNHIAHYFTPSGWPSRAINTISWLWIVLVIAYFIWVWRL